MIAVIPLWELLLPGFIATPGVLYQMVRHPDGFRPLPSHPPWLASSLEIKAYHALERVYPNDRYLISAHMRLIDVISRSNH